MKAKAAALLCCAILTTVASRTAADEPTISGVVSGAANAAAGAGASPVFGYGMEQYANLRLKADAGDSASVYAAVNLIAASGANAAALAGAGLYTAGDNYAAALELERLYVSLRGERTDADFGLMRLAFGYGQAFRPSDFLNPPNPLVADARPRGSLGAVVKAYTPADGRLSAFVVAGEDPLAKDGSGMLIGASADAHFSRASVQGLYAYRTPDGESSLGAHRAGLSVKLEATVGIALDATYALIPADGVGLDGLEAAVGVDYSFMDGKLYALAQYLYNGPGMLHPDEDLTRLDAAIADVIAGTAPKDTVGVYNRRNYALVQAQYSFSDYTRAGLSCLAGLDDLSFSPTLSVEHEPFQGMTLTVIARAALDERTLTGSGERGELGPEHTGAYATLSATAKLRF